MEPNKIKLTDPLVRDAALPAGKKEAVIWDTEVTGFGLRMRGASKSFVVVYRPAGQGRAATMRRLKIGTPASIATVKEARRLALAALGKVAAGGDPAVERRAERKAVENSVEKLLERYEAHLALRQYVARNAVLSLLRRRLEPLLGRDIASVKAWEYAELIERIGKKERPSAAASFRTRCSTFLNWCAFEARVLEANPLAGYRRGRDTRAERVAKTQRGRALSDAELVKVWQTASPETSFGRLVRFLILTGCRRGEGANLVRPMVDRKAGRIDLPATYTKQARGHTVYVAPLLEEVLGACEPDGRRPDLLFPSPVTGGPFQGWSKIMDRNDKRTQGGETERTPGFVLASGVDFSLHDLRRTFRTGLSRLGVDREIAELALGHARADLEARYNRDDCEAALRDAFGRWAAHVAEITREPEASIFD